MRMEKVVMYSECNSFATPEDLSVQRNIVGANEGARMKCMAVFLILA